NIPSHHLSQVINDRIGLNFFDFVNSYRIKEATRLLSDSQKSEYTIIELAYESGFNSKSTFNSAFKRFAGSTPTEFRTNKVAAPL
ncbi:MAG: helix-turn-helix domain-containing protein, partial [Bacteroidetes bacterium]|nr:helix-turn-helix domain-containing protein [Bacteroidota bacterium]